MRKLKIEKQFEALLRPLNKEEEGELEQLILENGITEPITVWGKTGIIIDGHHRYKIACKHNIDFDTKEVTFRNKVEAIAWIIRKQKARRNLTKEEFTLLIGSEYNDLKQQQGGDRKSESFASLISDDEEKSSVQNEHLKTADKVAEKHGVSSATVRRMAKEAEVVSDLSEEDQQAYLNGTKDEKTAVKEKINGRLWTRQKTEEERKDERDIDMSTFESDIANGNIPDADKRIISKLKNGEIVNIRIEKFHHALTYVFIKGLWNQINLT